MKKIIYLLFLFLFSVSFAQNQSNAIHKSAVAIIKSSPQFDQFIIDYNIKGNNFSVDESLYPICVFCSIFGQVNCCKSVNWTEFWPNEKVDNLKVLGDSRNKKFTLLFTNTENSYFVSELSHEKSKNKHLLFLFQVVEDKVTLIKTAIYLSPNN